MKVNSSAKWMTPFVVEASPMVPNLKKLLSLRFIRQPKKIFKSWHGLTTHDTWNDEYEITIYKNTHKLKSKKPFSYTSWDYSTIETLVCLAHELAHLHYWEHSPEHKMLEARLTHVFMAKLKKMGYTSDEHEEKFGFKK